jgi:hypothetical protein
MSTEDEVRQACDQYYAALNHMLNGDAELMMEVWSHSSDVTVMHPVAGLPVGWEQVRASWEQFAHLCSGGQVILRDPLFRVGTTWPTWSAPMLRKPRSLERRSPLSCASPTSFAVKPESGRASTSTLMSCQRCKQYSPVCKQRRDKPARSFLNLLQWRRGTR